jgi:phosphonate transport system permease protein
VRRVVFGGAVGAAFILCWLGAGVEPSSLLDPANLRTVGAFVRGLFPPDLSPGFLAVAAVAAIRTLAISIAGTALSVIFGLCLGILGTASLWRRGPLVDGRPGPLALLSLAARGIARFLRSVPDLVWALLFVVAFGLGPLPGTLALAVSYAGVLGRVYADLFEAVPEAPVLALHAAGASPLKAFVAAIWPQAAGSVAAYTLYSFECCVRSAAVLGFVGAGGIGAEITLSMRLFEYGQVTTLLGALVALVLCVDALSRGLRGRFRRNAVHGGGLLQGPLELRPMRRGYVFLWAIVALVAFADAGFGSLLAAPDVLAHVARFAGQLFPPDLSPSFLGSILTPLWQTVAISVVGTALGVVLGGALAVPATASIMFDPEAPLRPLRALAYGVARAALALLRSIPELVWVLLCILAVGLGPFAGVLALGLHTAGVLGKLYAETIEEVSSGAPEELRAIGAPALQRLVWAAWPQARETLATYTLLRWENNLRVSTVVGLAGGGGLGLALYNAVQLGFYDRAATLVVAVFLLVSVTDALADRVRRKPAAQRAPESGLALVAEAG